MKMGILKDNLLKRTKELYVKLLKMNAVKVFEKLFSDNIWIIVNDVKCKKVKKRDSK